jgi:hypothetical protein
MDIQKRVLKLIDYPWERLNDLDSIERIIKLSSVLDAEVNNGGFDQFFINSSGDYTDEIHDAVKEIGAERKGLLLERAISLWPNSRVPKDRDTRIRWITEEAGSSVGETWESLDREYYALNEDLESLSRDYLLKKAP